MTIPSRPAPPPPTTSIAQNPTSLGRLQQNQLQNQHHLHQNQNQLFASNGGVEKLTIKLPPPPNCRTGGGSGGGTIIRSASTSSHNSNNNNNIVNNVNNRNCNNINICTSSSSGSITRKFPPANVRYSPATDWDGSPFEPKQNIEKFKKIPPPRPPPPKIIVSHLNGINGNGIGNRQKSRQNIPTAPPPQQQSVNILTNIFNRKKSTKITGSGGGGVGGIFQQKKSQKTSGRLTPNQFSSFSSNTNNNTANIITAAAASNNINNVCNYNLSQNNTNYGSVGQFGLSHTHSNSMTKTSSLSSIIQSSSSFSSIGGGSGSGIGHEPQLISFDSPPSSPTFTQKSNSDCVSVDSFSSDSNFSSPNNGSASQPESGFEDDFTATRSTTSPLDPWESLHAFRDTNYCYENNMTTNAIGTAPVRNFSTINTRIQNSNDNLLCNGKSLLPPIQSLTMPTIIKPKISQKPRAPKPPASQATQFFGSYSMISKQNYFEEQHGNDDDDNQPGTPPSPPMPKCPPPPPPPSSSSSSFPSQTASSSTNGFSMLDVISGKIDILSLDSKHESSSGSHEIPENAEPYGIALYDFDGAVDGDLSFRENEKIYILEKLNEEWLRGRTRSGCEGIFPANYIEIKVPLSEFKKPIAKVQAQNFIKNPIRSPPKVRCLYMFNAEEPGDLALQENDIVTVLYRINEDWLYGEIDGRNGQFPSNFLEYVPSNLPPMPSC